MIMADQDYDGSHIKGLLINFFHYFWPDLLLNFELMTFSKKFMDSHLFDLFTIWYKDVHLHMKAYIYMILLALIIV